MNVNHLFMSSKFISVLCLLVCLSLGCIAEENLEDGLVQGVGKLNRATLSLNEAGVGQVDFEFVYLIGVNDSDGVQQFDWSYRLINAERVVFGENEQVMRQAEPEKQTIYVQGSKPRILDVAVADPALDSPLVLWITVHYGEQVITEVFLELDQETPHEDDTPLPKLNRFAQGA